MKYRSGVDVRHTGPVGPAGRTAGCCDISITKRESFMPQTLRVGLIGASNIAVRSMIKAAHVVPNVEILAVSARDPKRAETYAAQHGIERVYASYADMLRDPDIDLAYVGTTPNAHAAQALAAISAGKAVLVEKPFAMNVQEARCVFRAAQEAGVRVFEAMHSLHHPLWTRIKEQIESGILGRIRHVEAEFSGLIPKEGDFRWDLTTGGGVIGDFGVYPLSWVQHILGHEFRVERAEVEYERGLDVRASAELLFDGGARASVRCSLIDDPARMRLIVDGENGQLDVINPLAPNLGHSLKITSGGHERTEVVDGPTTFEAQLAAVRDTLKNGMPFPLATDHYVHSMEAIDRFRAASLSQA